MVNAYARAYTEVLEIISHLSYEERNKIPKEKIEYFTSNKDNNYIFKINPDVCLHKQNISSKANAILVSLFKNYFASEKQKDILDELLIKNQQKCEEEKYGFNPDEVFKENMEYNYDKENETDKEALLPVENIGDKWYQKILNFFKCLFNR